MGEAEATAGGRQASRPLVVVHDILVVLIVALRPLCWDGQPGQIPDLLWQLLVVAGLWVSAIEGAAGLGGPWRWSWRGMLGAFLVLALLPAALASPEPAVAWCRWSGWAACLGAAVYLAQVVPTRMRLATAALLGALAVQIILALAQKAWVLPAMAQAQAAGSETFASLGVDGGELAERIRNGGVYTTFTLSNQLGAWMALVLPLAVGLAAAGRGWLRWAGVLLIAIGLFALSFANAKGAWLALAIAGAAGWWVVFRGRWWRWLPLPLALLAVVVGWWSHVFDGSAHVRLGYWRAATALVREAPWGGHGLDAFAAHYPRLMRPGDEPTIFVHDEPLEAAIAGGAWLGLLALATILAVAWPRRAPAQLSAESTVHPAVPWALALLIPYLALFGALDGNLGWWPGVAGEADGFAAKMGWAVALGLGAAGATAAFMRAPLLPGWAWTAALAGCAFGPLIDFDWHAAGYLGSVVAVACIAPGAWRIADGAWGRLAAVAVALALTVVVVLAAQTGRRLVAAEDTLALLRAAPADPAAVRELARRFGGDPGQPSPELLDAALASAWEQAAGAPRTRLAVLAQSPRSGQATARAEALAGEAPTSAVIALHLANRLLGERRWAEAAAAAERAATLSPTAPRILDAAAGILERVAAEPVPGGHAARAAALRAAAARLQPLVDPRMREPASAIAH